jgi:DNA repair protein SbcC/Rad50
MLKAFGPFTEVELDLGPGDPARPDLHLVYGPNEAGKSSALRAMTDLRFGIPLRSPDDFLHPFAQMRIGGIFEDDQGRALALMRRKGRGETLSACDSSSGEPGDPSRVGREIEQALTGGLDREGFEALFGLNHQRLREGGDLLLKGEGELGAALFEASAGTRGIAAILAGLEADAKALYNPHGRAQAATINEARRRLEEERQRWRQAQTRPADWEALRRAHEEAREVLAEIDRALETERRRDLELTELRTVQPLLREHDRTLEELAGLAEVPGLPEDARERRLRAEQALDRAEQDLAGAGEELARCAAGLADLVIESPLLAHAEAIERLAAGVEGAARGRVEARQQQALAERIEAELEADAGRITPGADWADLVGAAPSAADRIALDAHLGAIARLGERLAGHRARAEELDQAADQGQVAEPPPDPKARQTLSAALRRARGLGDVARQLTDLEREAHGLKAQLDQALADLRVQSAAELRAARPLLDAQISEARKALADLEQEALRLCDEDARLVQDLAQQRLRQRRLAAAGEVVTGETLRLARGRRDLGWGLVRQAYVEGDGDPEALGLAFDPDRPLPEAFEAAQGDADRQADLLRSDAERAVGYEECAARIHDMERRRQDIVDQSAGLAARRAEVLAGWAARLAEAQVPLLDPEALREWQGRRRATLDLADRLTRCRSDLEQRQGESAAAGTALAGALQAVGEVDRTAMGGEILAALIDQAEQWERCAAETEVRQAERAKAESQRRAERARTGGLIAKAEAELVDRQSALDAWRARLRLPAGSPAEAVKARLDELDALARRAGALTDARLRQAQHQALADDFAARAAELAGLLGEPVPASAEDLADRLRRRLDASREGDRQRQAFARDQARAEGVRRQAAAERGVQAEALSRLCAAAGVADPTQLPTVEERAGRKRMLQARLAVQREQLGQAATRPEAALREALAGLDAVAIDAARERCRGEVGRLEQEQGGARQREEQTRRALEVIDASDAAARAREAMESAAARFRSAIRPWVRLRLAHALLQEALKRFRERAQAPMVAAASTYFDLMTGGRYPRLRADEDGERPVLRAERADGAVIGVEAMSEGTADQLYLALRLAALTLRRGSHPRMPLILDDVLVTSDDERAANILRALARFAEGGQVLVFTHHRHLLDLARTALRSGDLAVHRL